jgi:hypothetical protein
VSVDLLCNTARSLKYTVAGLLILIVLWYVLLEIFFTSCYFIGVIFFDKQSGPVGFSDSNCR